MYKPLLGTYKSDQAMPPDPLLILIQYVKVFLVE